MGKQVWDQQEALAAIRSILSQTCGTDPSGVVTEARLVSDLQVDSLGMLEALMHDITALLSMVRRRPQPDPF